MDSQVRTTLVVSSPGSSMTQPGVTANTPQDQSNGVCLVVGANRGIGLALASALARKDSTTRLVVTHRPQRKSDELAQLERDHPGVVEPLALDVTQRDSLAQLESFMGGIEGGFDLAIHTVGLLHAGALQPEKSLAECQPENLARLFEINAIAPLMVSRALLANLERTRPFKFAALSAMVGSIGDNRRGGWYGYRASKAALNQFLRTLSRECRWRFPRATIVALHPGTTDTALSKPFQKNIDRQRLYTPGRTAERLLRVLDLVDERNSGQFINWNGEPIPW